MLSVMSLLSVEIRMIAMHIMPSSAA